MIYLDLTIAIVLFFVGTGLAANLGWMLFLPSFNFFLRNFRSLRAKQNLKKADFFLNNGKIAEGIAELRNSFVLTPALTKEMFYTIRDHNQNLLSRCIIVAEEKGVRLVNIAQVERLFMEQAEAQLQLFKAQAAFSRVIETRQRQREKIPDWGRAEFERRIKSNRRTFEEKNRELERALDELFMLLRSVAREDIVYH